MLLKSCFKTSRKNCVHFSAGLNLSGVTFNYSWLDYAHFQAANLSNAELYGFTRWRFVLVWRIEMTGKRFNTGDPVAYFITWTTCGTWLPGDERGWHKGGVGGIQPPNEVFREAARSKL